MDLERLTSILEAYGANPERWPAVDRESALALLDRSPEARARRAEVARLDAVLNAAPAAEPSLALVARALAAAPGVSPAPAVRRAPRWPWLAVATSIAAAAAVALWVRSPEPSAPTVALNVAQLGVYAAPTDVLLAAPSAAFVYGVPDVGCEPSELGCPDLDLSPGKQSTLPRPREIV